MQPENSTYCRLINYPNCVNDENLFDIEHFMEFKTYSIERKKIKTKRITSIFLKSRIGEDEKIHACGTEIAEIKNSRIRMRKEKNNEQFLKEDQVIYLGFYNLQNSFIGSVNSKLNHSQLSVVYYEENNCKAHYHIVLSLNENITESKYDKLLSDRRKTCYLLANFLEGPVYTTMGTAVGREDLFELLPKLPDQFYGVSNKIQ